jgi:arylsulfatase A-like enzyme
VHFWIGKSIPAAPKAPNAIFYLDKQLGILLEELSRRGVLDDTVVIVASDHGEHLGDHGLFFHGNSFRTCLSAMTLKR